MRYDFFPSFPRVSCPPSLILNTRRRSVHAICWQTDTVVPLSMEAKHFYFLLRSSKREPDTHTTHGIIIFCVCEEVRGTDRYGREQEKDMKQRRKTYKRGNCVIPCPCSLLVLPFIPLTWIHLRHIFFPLSPSSLLVPRSPDHPLLKYSQTHILLFLRHINS